MKKILIIIVMLLAGIVTISNTTVVTYASDDQSITDVMGGWGSNNKPDEDSMNEATGFINSTLGVALSVIIYIIFAMIAFTTACDIAYIAIPPLRPMLYTPDDNTGVNMNNMGGMSTQQMNYNSQIPQQNMSNRQMNYNNQMTQQNQQNQRYNGGF